MSERAYRKHEKCTSPFCGVLWDDETEPSPCAFCDLLFAEDEVERLEEERDDLCAALSGATDRAIQAECEVERFKALLQETATVLWAVVQEDFDDSPDYRLVAIGEKINEVWT